MICTAHPIFFVDQIKKTEMGRARSAYGGEERCIRGLGGGNLRERAHLEDPGLDRRIILR
jgi:hypothetical protein